MPSIYLDADACPVKEQVFRVAARYRVALFVVANSPLRIPSLPGLSATPVVVGDEPDAADDWIADRAVSGDLVLTADIPLAARVIAGGAAALDFKGRIFHPNGIGDALASRELNALLRTMGLPVTGPPPFSRQDRARFASALDTAVSKLARAAEAAADRHPADRSGHSIPSH